MNLTNEQLNHLDAFIDDVVRVESWAIDHLPHATWPAPHPLLRPDANPRLRRDTVGDTCRELVVAAERGDFPTIAALRKTVEWTLSELYWQDRAHELTDADRKVRCAAERLLAAMDAAN